MSESILDRLTSVLSEDGRKLILFAEPEIRAKVSTVIDLPGGLLAVDDSEDWNVQIALFVFVHGPATDVHGVQVDPVMYECIMHGSGPSGSLRELRHTTWGELDNPGYIYYVNARLITGAFAALEKWFDLT